MEKWECDLLAELKQNKEMATFFANVKIVEPLDARESFYGGRTNATVLYHKVCNFSVQCVVAFIHFI